MVMSPDAARGLQGTQRLQQMPRVSLNTVLGSGKGDD